MLTEKKIGTKRNYSAFYFFFMKNRWFKKNVIIFEKKVESVYNIEVKSEKNI